MTRVQLTLVLIVICCGWSRAHATDAPAPLAPVPSPAQLKWHEDELTLFCHFGMNTFTGRGTGLGTEDEKTFNPTDVDCKQWVKTARESGFKGIILTAKHHDGFCLWPTASTEHSVKKSPWKDGKGDVVRELSDACKEANLKFGIYCSPYDLSVPFYLSDPAKYAAMYKQQLTELLSNYGPVYEMWFDGNKANVATWPDVVALVRKLQPDAVIKQGPLVKPVREDLRWVGNEAAKCPITNWCVYPAPGTTLPKGTTLDDKPIWFPLECDTMMNGSWFWNENPPKPLATVMEYYYTSVGRGSILMLNVAPDKRGKYSDECVTRMHEFHDALDKIFGKDFAAGAKTTATNVRGNDAQFGADKAVDGKKETYWATDDGVTTASIEIDLGGEQVFNVVRLEEMISLGQRVQEYKVESWSGSERDAGKWKQIASGTTIGYRKLDRFPQVTASKLRITIVKALACPTIKSIGVHLDEISPKASFEPANALSEYQRAARNPRTTTRPQ